MIFLRIVLIVQCQGQDIEHHKANSRLLAATQIDCANYNTDMNLPLSYILFTQNTFYTCYEANPEPSTYKYETILALPEGKRIKFATEINIFDCPIGCLGCYTAQNMGQCIECLSLTRSYSRYPTVAEIINRGIFNCGCSTGLVEVNKADCECPSSKYMVADSPAGLFHCYACLFNYLTCTYDQATGEIKPLSCMPGTGRRWDITSLCSCDIGYREYTAPGQNCELYCMQPCASCKPGTSQQCLTCTDQIMEWNFPTSECRCPKFYFMNTYYHCYSCQFSCLTCNSFESCSSCNLLDNRIIGKSGFCECLSGFLEDPNSSQCRTCHTNCLTCESQYDVCSACLPSTQRILIGYQCLCKDYYFDNGNVFCDQCHFSCKQCKGPLTTDCISCAFDKFLVLQINKCICQYGYGFTDISNQQCQVCNTTCQTCNYVNYCTACFQNSNRFLIEFGQCNCDDGFYDFNQSCQKCHFSCKSCNTLNPNICLSCYNDDGRMLSNTLCICQQGYFEDNQFCIPCHYSCQTCSNQSIDGCTTCPISRQMINNTCKCSLSNQIDDGFNQECVSCHFTCKTCYGVSANNCLSCQTNNQVNRFLQYGICTCPSRWFDDGINEKCQQCHVSCFNCMNPTRYGCVGCSNLDYRKQFSNSCLCFDGYYENQQSLCQPCSYQCLTCNLDQSNCLTCPLKSYRQLVQQLVNKNFQTCECIKNMPSDQQGNPICQPCHYSCANCQYPSYDSCTLCDELENRYLTSDLNGSYCKCKPFYYDVGISECAECSSKCLKCMNIDNNCTSCNPNQFRVLDGNKCICATRYGQQYLSYFDNQIDDECLECHYSCNTCSGSQYDECLTCSDQDFRYKQDLECICKSKYIDNGVGICIQCEYNCETCFGNKQYCTSCQQGSLRILNISSQSCECPDGYFDSGNAICEKCDKNCDLCNHDVSQCLSCKFGTNRIYNNMTLRCDCLYGYYDAGDGNCHLCHFSCLQCQGPSSSDCIQCSDYLTTLRIFIYSQCLCQDRYYDDSQSQICQSCSPTCFTCQNNQNYCTQCNDGQNRVLNGSSCDCMEQYYETGGSVCTKCSLFCLNCINYPNQCTKCDANLNRYLKQQSCECQSGFYDDGQLLCQPCHYSCMTCITNNSNCTSCEQNNFRQLINNQCICQQGTVDDGMQKCKSCDTRCQTCSSISTICLSCNDEQFRILVGQQCKCQDGYFENSINQCQICSTLCQNCLYNQDNCISCDMAQNKILSNYQCICQNGYYTDQQNNCQICSPYCLLCQNSASYCLSCKMERILLYNQCQCSDGSYDDGQNQCLKCSNQCSQCLGNANNCTSCSTQSKRILNNNKCDCLQGYYDIGTLLCLQCNYQCKTCVNESTNCLSCEINRILINNNCDCQAGYFDYGFGCQVCSPQCKTCSKSSENCTTCDQQYYREDYSIRLNQCPCMVGFYDDSTSLCKKCSYQCINCEGQSTNCIYCNGNLGYFRTSIPPMCGCQDRYFDDGIQIVCQKCNYQCLQCEFNVDNCTLCESQMKRTLEPICQCKSGYYKNDSDHCQECSKKCLTCLNSSENCLTCQPDRITKNCICQDGYFEGNQEECQQCSHKCDTCELDKLNCLICGINRINAPNCICQDNYFDDLINIECQKCDQYCLTCDFHGCIECAGNRIKQEKSCICPIDSISYLDSIWCSNCDVAVVVGQFSDDLTSILYKFEYPLKFNFTQKVEIQENCQYIIQMGIQLLGDAQICQIDNDTLIIQLGLDSKVIVDDNLNFSPQFFQHQSCERALTKIVRTNINEPVNKLVPEIQLLFPKHPVSPCQEISISITNQMITGQRNLILQWQIVQQQFPEIISANQFQYQTITFESLPQNTNLELKIHFTNFLNQSNVIQVKIQTLASSSPQLQLQSQKQTYYSWIPIKLIATFQKIDCFDNSNNNQSKLSNIEIKENISQRNPQESNYMVQQLYYFSQSQVNILIQKRALSTNTNYTLQSQIDNIQSDVILQIQKSPLQVQIYGGTRIQNFRKELILQINAKDPDYQDLWNTDIDIQIRLNCYDIALNQPCKDIYKKQILLNTTYIQYLQPNLFNPFTVLKFQVICTKKQLVSADSVYIIFLDDDFPILNVTYPQGYKMRDININEQLQFQIQIQQDQDQQEIQNFRFGLVYNYELVYIEDMKYPTIKFAIWDKFIDFQIINQISVKFYSQFFLHISLSSHTFTINKPPINSVILINPQEGQAYFTKFNIKVVNSKDKDTPLQYRFAYYLNQDELQQDLISNSYYNLRLLQDFSVKQQFSGILESGNLILIISVADSMGSIVNFTQQVKVISFYEQMKMDLNNTDINKCQQFIDISTTELYSHLILSQELINLSKHNLSIICTQQIQQKLFQFRDQLKLQLIEQTDYIYQARILNVLNQIQELNFNSRRLQESEQQQILCLNKNTLQIRIDGLSDIDFTFKETNQTQQYVQLLQQKVQEIIEQGYQLFKEYQQSLDFGDQQTFQSLQQNLIVRKSFITTLGQIYQQSYESKTIIIDLIRQIMDSFQCFLETDKQGIVIQSEIGVQIFKYLQQFKNSIGQSSFNKYLIKDFQVDAEEDDSINLERFIQIARYPSNAYIYSKNFTNQFKDGKNIIYLIDNQTHYYEQSVIHINSIMFDPFIYVDLNQNINLVEKIYKGKISYHMDTVSECNESTSDQSIYTYVCANYHNYIWKFDECQILYYEIKGQTQIFCQCQYLNPITLMILNTTNYTKTQIDINQKIEISQFIQIIYYSYTNIVSLLLIMILISFIIYKRSQVIHIYDILYQLDVMESEQADSLTTKQKFSLKLFKQNIYSLHELSRIVVLDYNLLPLGARILLTYINISIALTIFHLINVVINNLFISGIISIFGQLICQVFIKILEGLFTGPHLLKQTGYFIAIVINIGLILLNTIINNSFENIIGEVLSQVIIIFIIYGPIEMLIQYFRLKFGFNIYYEYQSDPFNPILNLIYYFIQDEATLCIFRGAIIK